MAVAWWQRIDLSEAHGLVLFWVIREGIGISRRPSVHDTVCGPTGDMDAHSRTRVSQEPIDHHSTKIISDGTGLFTETLKLLAVSLCRRRSSLLSSTQL